MTERPLHIAYMVHQFPPEVGAGPARVTEMGARWMASGNEVTVVTAVPHRSVPGQTYGVVDPGYRGRIFSEDTHQGLRVLRSWVYSSPAGGFARTILNNLSFMATGAMHALFRAGRPDVLIASSPPFFVHIAGVAVAIARRIPLVLEVRDLWPDYLLGMGLLKPGRMSTRALFALERWMLCRADHVVVVTESFRRQVIAKGVAPDRVTVLPNGVDGGFYRPASEPAPVPELQRKGNEIIVGYMGTFGAGQALSNIVEAAAILAGTDPDVRVVLIGDGPDKPRVEACAAELAPPNLALLPPIDKSATRAFYNACDVCLVPLAPVDVFQETIPSKIFEVMACGRPVLGSFGGEGQAIVEKSGGGLVAPPGDAPAIAAAVRRFKAMPAAERTAMGERGRQYVTANYDRRAIADAYLELLHAVARR